MRTRSLFLLAVFLALPDTPCAQEGGVLLKYAYPSGKKVIYKIKSNTDLSVGIQANNLLEWTSVEELTGVREDGSSSISAVISGVSESVFVGGQLIRQKVFDLLVGEAFHFSLTPTGTLKDFVPPPLKNLPGSQREALQIVVTNLELLYASYYPELPKGPVRVGDSWTARREIKLNYEMMRAEGSALISSVYKIKAAKKKDGFGCFEIEEKSQITIRQHINFGEISVITDGTGTATDKWLFDYERGITQSYEEETKIDVQSIRVGIPGAKPVESLIKASSKRELKKIE
ncbi:MAG: hypothetical protein A3F84_09120 [Candidatus Handelsmanbacteria bacterium RIFCSPLOWO2_12_FULL_64_10]|uniref:DUF3108 domain-containing protein n=1 Tax=Handelsmanbacteria sp. (strain RIFCSPLOWO2_12_FULL_64_10) TaxID=1817868 RepID=A0A1F6CSW8_HANXR|nr:MAG: hypothetical protein A3F84_09120 [Candidatus Handelsmanbacteria bacterium RIFCSPLOWO2_12_FULL_64_10]